MSKDKKPFGGSQTQGINGYSLTKKWFGFAMDNPGKVKPIHAALYLWIVELDNKLGWREEFGLPTLATMRIIGIKDRRFFRKALNDLERWRLIRITLKARNQYAANKITLITDDELCGYPNVSKQKNSDLQRDLDRIAKYGISEYDNLKNDDLIFDD